MKKAVVLCALLHALDAPATTTVASWTNPACEIGACELKGARFFLTKVNDRRNRIAGNSIVAELETAARENLKDFVFVQYLRGCYFARVGSDVRMGMRNFFGRQGQTFRHASWELDSGFDADPVYSSYADAGPDSLRGRVLPRNASYYTANPLTARSYDWWSGLTAKVTGSRLYVSDELRGWIHRGR